MPGFRQKRQAELRAERSRSPEKHCEWGWAKEICNWMHKWSKGSASASDIVRDAAAKDKHDNELSKRIAAGARHLGNAERLLESIAPVEKLPPTLSIADSEIDTVVLPYDSFHWLRKLNRRKFCRHLGAYDGGMEAWWASLMARADGPELMARNQWVQGRSAADLKWYVPLMLFDDAGPVANNESSYARCYYAVTGRGSDTETRIIMCTGLKNDDLVDKSWQPILASFDRLAGPIAPGDEWGAVPIFLGSDLEYVCQVVGMQSYNNVNCCAECEANGSTLPHNDFSAGALWRATVRDHDAYMAKFRQPRHALVAHGWFNKHTYRYDLLHMWDHHGITSTAIGCIFDHHVKQAHGVLPGPNQQARLDFLNDDIKASYSMQAVSYRLPKLKLSNLSRETDFPELHGQAVKAANTRAAVPYCLELQRRAVAMDPSPLEKHMFKVIESSDALYKLVYNASFWLNDGELDAFSKHCRRIGNNWQMLAILTAGMMQRSWPMRPKLHYSVAHMPTQAALINPRFVQAYASESMVGRVAKIYKHSMDGPHTHVQAKVMLKYLTFLLLVWCDAV